MTQKGGEGSYIVEYYALGKSIKVTAIDPVTMTEVSIVGDRNASKDQLNKLAIRKLQYVMNKKAEE